MQIFAKTLAVNLNLKCDYIDARDEFTYLSSLPSWEKNTYFDDVDELSEIPVLFIDNFGEEIDEENRFVSSDLVFEILKRRKENNLITFFTSKYSLEELKEKYSLTKNGKKNGVEIVNIIRSSNEIKYLKSSIALDTLI